MDFILVSALQYRALGDMPIWLAAGFSRCFCLRTKSCLLLFEHIVMELSGPALSGDTSAVRPVSELGCRGGARWDKNRGLASRVASYVYTGQSLPLWPGKLILYFNSQEYRKKDQNISKSHTGYFFSLFYQILTAGLQRAL